MTDPGFTVSVPDLLGFTDQLETIAGEYENLGKGMKLSYKIALNVAEAKSPLAGNGGMLLSSLGAFKQMSDDLMKSHVSACKVMSRSMDSTAERLGETAQAYAEQDSEAEAALDGGNPSQDDKDTAKAITGGEAKFDWKLDFAAKDYLIADIDGTVLPEFSFKPTMKSTKDTLMKVLGSGPFTSLDALVKYFGGFSLVKEACKPLLGDWGILWYLADMFRGVAEAPTEIGSIVMDGTNSMIPSIWAGKAAEGFSSSAVNWNHELGEHAQLFVESGTKLESIANNMDIHGTKIADATAMVADLAVEVAVAIGTGGLSVLSKDAVKWVGKLVFAIPTVVEAIEAFADFLDLATTDLGNLLPELADLNPPGNLQDTNS